MANPVPLSSSLSGGILQNPHQINHASQRGEAANAGGDAQANIQSTHATDDGRGHGARGSGSRSRFGGTGGRGAGHAWGGSRWGRGHRGDRSGGYRARRGGHRNGRSAGRRSAGSQRRQLDRRGRRWFRGQIDADSFLFRLNLSGLGRLRRNCASRSGNIVCHNFIVYRHKPKIAPHKCQTRICFSATI